MRVCGELPVLEALLRGIVPEDDADASRAGDSLEMKTNGRAK